MSKWSVSDISISSETTTTENAGVAGLKNYSSSEKETNVFLNNVRVYIAGVLVPVAGFTLHTYFNSMPKASIVLPANPKLFGIGFHDRVPVHIFMQESVAESSEFILMFEGFIASKTYLSMSSQREINLSLISYVDVFNDMRYRLLTNLTDAQQAVARDASANATINIQQYPNMVFTYGLGYNGAESKPITMPTEYLANIIRLVEENNSDVQQDPGSVHHNTRASEFYGSLCKTLHMDQRFAWLPYFDYQVSGKTAANMSGQSTSSESDTSTIFPMLYGLQQKEAIDTLQKKATQCSKEQTMMELLQYLIREMEYEFIVFTSPSYYEGKNSSDFGSDMDSLNMKYSPDAGTSRMVNFTLKPLFNDAFPPKCNILFRSQIQQLTINEQCVRVPTRIEVNGLSPKAVSSMENSGLAQFVDVKYYPSQAYSQKDPTNTTNPGDDDEATELEKYTGPWVARSTAPEWFTYLSKSWDENNALGYQERFMRRQLLLKKYMDKTIDVVMAFNPYVTPGFPAVVFDSYDSNLAFAGYVTGVSHTVGLTSTTTTVSMMYARLLDNAIANHIPSPIDALNEIDANEDYLTKVYSSIIGKDVEAISFENVKDTWGQQGGTSSASDPQNNIYEAYKIQRRNIITLDEYCTFMGLSTSTENLPDGEQVINQLKGDFVDSRCKLNVYDTIPMDEKFLPAVKTTTATKKSDETKQAEAQKEKGGGTSSDSKSDSTSTTESSTTVDSSASTDAGAQKAAEAQQAKGGGTSADSTKSNIVAQNKEEEDEEEDNITPQSKRTSETSASVDLVEVLKEVAEEEFANHIY